MKLLSALFASVGVALSTAALAADLPTHKEAPPPAPYVAPFSWTGFYIGGYAGGSFGSVDWSSPLFSGGTVTSGGFDIGGLAGFNYQFGGENPAGFHAVNILLHGAVSLLLLFLLEVLGFSLEASALAAAAFAGQPCRCTSRGRP